MSQPYSNPFDDCPFWALPFTKSGRRFLGELVGITPTPAPQEDVVERIKCFACDHQIFRNGRCEKCGVEGTTCSACTDCGLDQAFPTYRPFTYNCAGCGKLWTKH